MPIVQDGSSISKFRFRNLGVGLASLGLLLVNTETQEKLSGSGSNSKSLSLSSNNIVLPDISKPLPVVSSFLESTLPVIDHLKILHSTTAGSNEKFAAFQVLLMDPKNNPTLYKFLLTDETRQNLINVPKEWSQFYQKFLEQLAPSYQVASSQIGGHFFRFAATNGTVELRVQTMKAWFDLGGDFGDLSQVHQANLSNSSRLSEIESKLYLEATMRILGDSILNKVK